MWQAAAAILIKPIYYNVFTNLLCQFSALFVSIGRHFSCKLEQFTKKSMRWFLLKKGDVQAQLRNGISRTAFRPKERRD